MRRSDGRGCLGPGSGRGGWAGGLLAALLVAGAAVAAAQGGGRARPAHGLGAEIDPGLARVLAGERAIDNHAHPVLPPPNDGSDRGFDALPVDNMEPQTDPVGWRADNPQLPAAWLALWGFAGTAPLDGEGTRRLVAARDRVKRREGEGYAGWVLDRAGIGTMLANRVALGPGLLPPRLRWVPYVDALLFPLDNRDLAGATPDRGQFFPLEDRLRGQYLAAVGLKTLPATLEEYLSEVVTPTLERQRAGGAVAVKFEVAYLRGFDFGDPPRAAAERVYARWARPAAPGEGSPAPPPSTEYKVLQDFLFRYIAGESGRLGMAVHLHAIAGGGASFDVAGVNPLLLEPVLDDPRLRRTNFVLLHGGWPFVHEAGALLQKPNVYLDVSQEALLFPARTLAGFVREWMELYPEKVLFATDGYPYSGVSGWEESTWMAAHNAREALGLALTGMLRDGEVSRARAEAMARGGCCGAMRLDCTGWSETGAGRQGLGAGSLRLSPQGSRQGPVFI